MGLDHVWSTMGLVSWWWLLGARLEGVSYEARMRLGGCHTGVQCGVRHPTQLLHLSFFFFLFFFSQIHVDSAQFTSICVELGRFSQNHAISTESSCIGRQPKEAEINLESRRNSQNRLWMRPKHPKYALP